MESRAWCPQGKTCPAKLPTGKNERPEVFSAPCKGKGLVDSSSSKDKGELSGSG